MSTSHDLGYTLQKLGPWKMSSFKLKMDHIHAQCDLKYTFMEQHPFFFFFRITVLLNKP